VVRLLERLGVELEFNPKQTCCGQNARNTGFRGEAFSQAKRLVRSTRSGDGGDFLLLLRGDDARSVPRNHRGTGTEELRKQYEALMPRVFELSDF